MTNELEQFLETPSTDDVADTADAPASAEAKTDANPDEGKGTNLNAEMPAAVKDESTAQPGAKHWAESAYQDEKRKRQELERRLQEVEKPAQEEKPDLFVDPDGFVKGVDEKIQKTALQDRISMSREFMLELKPDYADKEARFIEMVKADPSLVAKMNASPMPAKFAYQTAAKALADEAKLKLVEEIGDPAAYKEKLKAEILAEMQVEQPKSAKPIVEKAPSLATASAAATNTAVTIPSLEEMFDGR